MAITSFTRAMLIAGGAVGVVGAGVGLFMLKGRREDAATERYIATDVPVDEFVDRTITAFDTGTWGSPLKPHQDEYRAREKQDGVLSLGVEDTVDESAGYFREIVDIPRGASYDTVVSGRAFLRRADADEDGRVTRDELTAAVRPFAGDDGRFSLDERRKLLTDEGLGKLDRSQKMEPIAGWIGNGEVETAYSAAQDAMYVISNNGGTRVTVGDEDAIDISKVRPLIPWNYQHLTTGDITSSAAMLAKLDEQTNGDGKLTRTELAGWIADTFKDPKLLYGHVKLDNNALEQALAGTRIARVDAGSLAGHVYYDTSIPKADVDRFFGGDIREFLDEVKGFKKARGDAKWEPDPLSGKPTPKPKDQDGG
jgi:hypothetical protein